MLARRPCTSAHPCRGRTQIPTIDPCRQAQTDQAQKEADQAQKEAEAAESKVAIAADCAKADVGAFGALFEGESVGDAGAGGQGAAQGDLRDVPVGLAGAYVEATIRISREVLFRRRPPSSVTVTMSSIRTPKRPAR